MQWIDDDHRQVLCQGRIGQQALVTTRGLDHDPGEFVTVEPSQQRLHAISIILNDDMNIPLINALVAAGTVKPPLRSGLPAPKLGVMPFNIYQILNL